MLYVVLKLVHVGAVMIFLGNISTGIFWKRNADRTRDPRIIAHAMEGIIRSDRLFTIPGVIVVVLAGVATAIRGHDPILRTGWIFWALVLFTVSGAAFGQVAPLQRKLLAAARDGVADPGARDWWERYEALSRRWDFWGAIALVTPLLAMALMVLKPAFPGIR
ncbi:MAG: DUF2269 family protein [Candidatus Eisenbacteria bacterium]